MGTIMLLDAASMYFRAFYGVPETMTAPDGTPVNAVKGLLDMIARLVRARHPARLIACMDASWRPAFRVAALPSYKTHRANPDGSEQVPDALNVQLPIIVDVLSAVDAGHGGFPAGSRAKLVAARPYLDACMVVVRVATDAPVKLTGGELPSMPAQPGRVAELDQRWDLGSSLGRALSALAASP